MKALPSTAKSLVGTLFTLALLAWSPLQTRADMIGFGASSSSSLVGIGDNVTLGYAFTVSTPVSVTMLGLFDSDNNGLLSSHAVTIWTSTGTQLVQATIPAGTGATLTNGFRYVSIAPFTLAAGTYTIAGFYAAGLPPSFDPALVFASITSASGISYVDIRSANGFVFPSGSLGQSNGYFGPNFQFTTAVPTPDSGSTISLLGFALLGLAALRRKLSCLGGKS